MARAHLITDLDPQAPTATNARIIARERLADMYVYASYTASPDNVQELHNLRIAAKRVRYTLEVFAAYLPATIQDFIEELATLQETLGALHDSEVMLALLHLSLQNEHKPISNEPTLTPPARRKKTLVSASMGAHLLDKINAQALSEQRHLDLAHFQLKQEQRRTQCYTAFRHHWKKLEENHFHDKLLALLASDAADSKSRTARGSHP